MAIRPTTFPKDDVLFVEAGTPAFSGWATAWQPPGLKKDVIIMAMTLTELKETYRQVDGRYPAHSACYQLVMIRKAEVVLDDEL